ncbi:hypothetical protein QRO11_07715 [Paracidovorax citrulli]|nr:hypothetical protein [Paracidovorax citrulli]ATG93415.1 hypothetical protein CQB05_04650 [Paracidovorax citrulli]MVT36950.1 hypothetical protein [Paracidovorax citrulli]PVY66780.1 hypothetical protein C8E08_4202 [Paracidovorax citrulli]QCX09312.1 hypothetical protein APS58_0353 [Paracidovorax citrulli]REG69056.1 hypothetical protein C8E07_2189 [Paracidovorax citrulli]
MRPPALLLKSLAATLLGAMAAGCAVPGDPYYGYGSGPAYGAPYPVGPSYPYGGSVTVYEQPTYVVPRPGYPVVVPPPGYVVRPSPWDDAWRERRDRDERERAWRERRDREAWEAGRRQERERERERQRERDRARGPGPSLSGTLQDEARRQADQQRWRDDMRSRGRLPPQEAPNRVFPRP